MIWIVNQQGDKRRQIRVNQVTMEVVVNLVVEAAREHEKQ